MASFLENPYKTCEMTTRISLEPNQMNSNLYKNLKNNLVKKVEGKCNEIGHIVRVYKITDYSQGVINAENFSGNAIYNIKYIANVCKPNIKSQIVVRIDMKSTASNNAVNIKVIKAIKATNGCIDCVITKQTIDYQKFVVNEDGTITYTPTGNLLLSGDYIKITVQNMNINKGMERILIIGNMNDIASQEEVEMYFKPNDGFLEETLDEKEQVVVYE